MWCPNCSADVATELSTDDRRLNCARCGQELQLSAAAILSGPRPEESPHDVLARWSAEDLISQDSRLSVTGLPGPTAAAGPSGPEVQTTAANSTVSEEHIAAPSAPIVPHHPCPPVSVIPPQNWVGVVGQFAAYGGVLILTAGTVAVISGHFGQTPRNIVNGWLLAAVGQMLLLLGVTTLISSGIEQSRHEMHQRLSRIEWRLQSRRRRTQAARVPASTPRRRRPSLRDAA